MGAIGENRLETKLDNELRSAYEKLGKSFYEKNTNLDIKGAYPEEFEQIERLLEEKRNMEVKMLAKQGKRKCSNCSNILVLESKFCNMCGERLEEISIDLYQSSVSSVAIPKCSGCGEVLDKDAIFCSNCGKKCD